MKVTRHFGDKLSTVRVHTSNTMVDQYFIRHQDQLGTFDPRGTNPTLIFALRDALDREVFNNVNIVVSGGFNAEKIAEFEKQNTPVDIYGVGSSLLKVNISFTGDNVLLDGQEQAKAGRRYRPNPRLERVLYGDNEIR